MDNVLRLLERWAEHPAPGYLFTGREHPEKRMATERFIRALLGVGENDGRPWTAHPDVVVVEPEEGKIIVSSEIVRNVRLRVAERPLVAPRIVVFIPRLDRLNEEGMNALLKVLEEPGAGAVFVTSAENQSRIPMTVQSRLVHVPFTASAAIHPSADAGRFLNAKTTGERLAIIEGLVKDCESSDNTADAWSSALDEWGETFRLALPSNPRPALVAGHGVITAKRFVGGALSPRLPLEAAALRLSAADPFKRLFPSMLSSSIPAIFTI